MPTDDRRPGEDVVDWALRTYRITDKDYAYWRGRVNSEAKAAAFMAKLPRSDVDAFVARAAYMGFRAPALGETEQVLRSLTPVPWIHDLKARDDGYHDTEPSESLIEQEDRILFGPPREYAHAQQDAAAEASLRAQLDKEAAQAAADAAISDDDWAVLFPPPKTT